VHGFVVLEVVRTQFGHMNHAFHEKRIERNKYAKWRHSGYAAAELFADMFLDKPALEPCLDIARGIVRTALASRQQHPQLFPDGMLAFFFGQCGKIVDVGELRYLWRAVANALADPVRKEVRIAAYGRGGMRIMLGRQAKVAHLLRSIVRLWQGPQ